MFVAGTGGIGAELPQGTYPQCNGFWCGGGGGGGGGGNDSSGAAVVASGGTEPPLETITRHRVITETDTDV